MEKKHIKNFNKKNGEKSKEILNEFIVRTVKNNGYDWKLNGDSIFWFCKGLTHSNLPPYLNQPSPEPPSIYEHPLPDDTPPIISQTNTSTISPSPISPTPISPEPQQQSTTLRELIESASPNVPLRHLINEQNQSLPTENSALTTLANYQT